MFGLLSANVLLNRLERKSTQPGQLFWHQMFPVVAFVKNCLLLNGYHNIYFVFLWINNGMCGTERHRSWVFVSLSTFYLKLMKLRYIPPKVCLFTILIAQHELYLCMIAPSGINIYTRSIIVLFIRTVCQT